jgi:hypothetical protein
MTARLLDRPVDMSEAVNGSCVAVTSVAGSGPALDFPQLPNKAQALICSLASAPSCPSYMLLARVSKSWGQAAAQHLQLNGVSVGLQLVFTQQQQRQHQEQRLASLETWLRQHGHLATSLSIEASDYGPPHPEYVVARGEAVAEIMDALAAAGSWSSGLPLQLLVLPVMGSISPTAIAVALSACHQLRELQLDANWSTNEVHYSAYLEGALPAALQKLEHLTSLTLELGVLKEQLGSAATVLADDLFACLPPRLEHMELIGKRACVRLPMWSFSLCISSLQHLVALKRLALPSRARIECRAEGATLAPLTALTHVKFSRLLRQDGAQLLELPKLACIEAGFASAPGLHVLAGRTALSTLVCHAPVDGDDAAVAAALAQLTSLRELSVRVEPDTMTAPDEAAWAQVLAALTGLCYLGIEAVLLQQVDMAALTALTEIQVEVTWGDTYHGLYSIQRALRGLTPAHTQLRRVVLFGVPSDEQKRFTAAVAAAPVNALLEFVS